MAEYVPDSGDPNRGRDKSKDIPICLDGNEYPSAVIYAGTDNVQVLWRVVGPQDAEQARKIAEGVIAALDSLAPRQPGVSPQQAPAAAPKAKSRPMSAALREHILAGLDDDAVWAKIVEEFACGPDKRYRIKEYRKELEAKQPAPAPFLNFE